MAASLHGNTPYSGKTVTSVPVTPYTTSVDVNQRGGSLVRYQQYDSSSEHKAFIQQLSNGSAEYYRTDVARWELTLMPQTERSR